VSDGIGHDDNDLIQPGIQLRQPVDGEDCIHKDKSYSLRMARSCPFVLDRGMGSWDRGTRQRGKDK
jgi:hypothetical protein